MRKIFFCFFLFLCFFSFPYENNLTNDDTELYIEQLLSSLTLEEKVGQLFFSIIYDDALNDLDDSFIARTKIGNFILFPWANNLNSFENVKSLTEKIKNGAEVNNLLPPLIAIDQEGGEVTRLKKGFTVFPSSRYIAENYDESFAYNMGKKMGKELKMAGINLNFAPVVDVCLDPTYWLASRSFSADPEVVISYAKAYIEGMHSEDILVTLKHFPGHGDAIINSHYGLPVIHKPLLLLEKVELKPFYYLRHDTDCIMTAHILFKNIDDQNLATFSKKILLDILRNDYGYQKLIISDSLAMKAAFTNQSSIEETIKNMSQAAISAFNAGCDMMILSKIEWADFETTKEIDLYIIEEVIENFRKAVISSKISEEKLNESLRRIIKTKLSFY